LDNHHFTGPDAQYTRGSATIEARRFSSIDSDVLLLFMGPDVLLFRLPGHNRVIELFGQKYDDDIVETKKGVRIN